MKRTVWIIAWLAVAIWSLVAWATYALLDVAGDLAARNADIVTGDPEIVEFLYWGVATLQSFGFIAVVVVWGLVSLLILGAAAVLARLLARPAPEPDWREPVRTIPPENPPPPPPARGPPSDVREVMRRIGERR